MIQGPVSLAEDREIREKARNLVHIVQGSVNRMLRLVNQLMDFNKLENDTLKLKVELRDVVQELGRTLDPFFPTMPGRRGLRWRGTVWRTTSYPGSTPTSWRRWCRIFFPML
ncbi:MAG: hypothetical protein R2751_10210 [Bacteroidales bacterium]